MFTMLEMLTDKYWFPRLEQAFRRPFDDGIKRAVLRLLVDRGLRRPQNMEQRLAELGKIHAAADTLLPILRPGTDLALGLEALRAWAAEDLSRRSLMSRVELTTRALAICPAGSTARERNAFVAGVFKLAGEPQSPANVRQLVSRAKRDK